jgi:formylmethanofuran dehydrogenase subunit E
MDFAEVVKFHGHVCPGLALGFRVAELAVAKMDLHRSDDEELVAIVENNSCAVDAIQMVTGCTFGKGNLLFRDYGKQVYTFIKRATGESLRIAVSWQPPAEDEKTAQGWQDYMAGNKNPEVLEIVKQSKARKVKIILAASFDDLFDTGSAKVSLPPKAQIYPTVICAECGEKVMSPKVVNGKDGKPRCAPCAEKKMQV